MIPSSIEYSQNVNASVISSIGAAAVNRNEDDDFSRPIPPHLIKYGKMHSLASSISASSLPRHTSHGDESENDLDGETPPSRENSRFPRRNRSDNLILWSQRDKKMFYVRIAAELYDESDRSFREPAKLPGCFSENEKKKIVQSVTTPISCEGDDEPSSARRTIRIEEKDARVLPMITSWRHSHSKKKSFHRFLKKVRSAWHVV